MCRHGLGADCCGSSKVPSKACVNDTHLTLAVHGISLAMDGVLDPTCRSLPLAPGFSSKCVYFSLVHRDTSYSREDRSCSLDAVACLFSQSLRVLLRSKLAEERWHWRRRRERAGEEQHSVSRVDTYAAAREQAATRRRCYSSVEKSRSSLASSSSQASFVLVSAFDI